MKKGRLFLALLALVFVVSACEINPEEIKTCCASERELKYTNKAEMVKVLANKIHVQNIELEHEKYNKRKFKNSGN